MHSRHVLRILEVVALRVPRGGYAKLPDVTSRLRESYARGMRQKLAVLRAAQTGQAPLWRDLRLIRSFTDPAMHQN